VSRQGANEARTVGLVSACRQPLEDTDDALRRAPIPKRIFQARRRPQPIARGFCSGSFNSVLAGTDQQGETRLYRLGALGDGAKYQHSPAE
jgi:hypothetical protein